jgi:transposase
MVEHENERSENLLEKTFETVTKGQVVDFDVSGKSIRMDSKLMGSNIAWLSRYELIHETLRLFCQDVKETLFTDALTTVEQEALQHLRIKYRWKELEMENDAIEKSKQEGKKYRPFELENGDTPKQLLARCRYILAKKSCDWTTSQKQRVALLFSPYPEFKKADEHTLEFRSIYELKYQTQARERLMKWIEKTDELKMKEFNTVSITIKYNLDNILNFFVNRSTNANAESFNAKIKLFRANLRGVTDAEFFLFRLHKLFA